MFQSWSLFSLNDMTAAVSIAIASDTVAYDTIASSPKFITAVTNAFLRAFVKSALACWANLAFLFFHGQRDKMEVGGHRLLVELTMASNLLISFLEAFLVVFVVLAQIMVVAIAIARAGIVVKAAITVAREVFLCILKALARRSYDVLVKEIHAVLSTKQVLPLES